MYFTMSFKRRIAGGSLRRLRVGTLVAKERFGL